MGPTISCIFVNYRSSQLLETSLQSLFLHEKEAFFEIIIVNNDASEAEALAGIQEQFPNVRIVQTLGNIGFAAAANQGTKLATGEILFFVNPDTRWHEAFFGQLQQLFREKEEVGVVGVALQNPQGKREAFSAGDFLTPSTLLRRALWRPRYATAGQIDWVSGGAMAIRTSLFRELKGFDERFFLYFEDMDLCLRVARARKQVWYQAEYSLLHFSGKSHTGRRLQKKYYDASLRYYVQKHWSPTSSTFFTALQALYRFFYPYGRS